MQDHHQRSHQHADTALKDPVCGMSVATDSAHHCQFGGREYYFCSAGCRDKFAAAPERYLAPRLDAAEDVDPSAWYTCPMHPEVRRQGPGACPKCGMALEREAPLLEEEENPELVDFSRRFWISLPLSFGVRHMCNPIAAFSKLHPDIRFDLNLNDRYVDLVEEGMDLGIRIGHLRDSSLIARKLFDMRSIVCASPGYLTTHGEPRTPAELGDHDCLVYSNLADPDTLSWKAANGRERSVRLNSIMRANSGDFLANAAAHGLGIVIQPTFLASESIRRGNLVPILNDIDWPTVPAHAVYPPTRHLSHRVRAFIDFLVERFAGTPQWDRDCEGA